MKPLASLTEVLEYENDEVVRRFSRENRISLDDAQDIFLETKRWLWLCASSPGRAVNMVGEAFVIDAMWHVFLLFTHDYAEFCSRYFPEFVHHVPKPEIEPNQARDARWREDLRKDYEYIYDRLGADTLLKWCQNYPEKFAALRAEG